MSDDGTWRDPLVQTQLDKSHGKIVNPALDYSNRGPSSIHAGASSGGYTSGPNYTSAGTGDASTSGHGLLIVVLLGVCFYFVGWWGIPVGFAVYALRAHIFKLILAIALLALIVVGLAWAFPALFEKPPTESQDVQVHSKQAQPPARSAIANEVPPTVSTGTGLRVPNSSAPIHRKVNVLERLGFVPEATPSPAPRQGSSGASR
jgi:hypothetical protein